MIPRSNFMHWLTRRWPGNIVSRKLDLRIPVLGETVWWAGRQQEGVVSKVNRATFEFVSGPPVFRQKSKKTVPFRYTTAACMEDARYDEYLKAWIVGTGPVPNKLPGTTVVRPQPLLIKTF